MSSQPIRIESKTLRALRERSAQGGESIVRLAQRYIDEGIRLDRHHGIVFRPSLPTSGETVTIEESMNPEGEIGEAGCWRRRGTGLLPPSATSREP